MSSAISIDHGDGVHLPTTQCLLVDDEPRLRSLLRRVMERDGYVCHEAGSGVEALDYLRTQSVDLVITDMSMPEMDGVTLLRHVTAQWPDIAVMMVSANADVDAAVEALAIGALDYLTKPFRIDEVRARVAQVVEKRRLVLENRVYREQLEQRVQEQARKLEDLFLTSLQSLVQALEVRDRYTHGHSLRVSRYAGAIARELRLPEPVVKELELGASLHDLGKIGVREAVLNKEGPLTDEEYAHIMEHPLIGWRLLGPLLRELPVALNVVRSHHERFDGRGLPDGLVGSEIPLEARIVAVADSFDAMTSVRPYRRGRSTEAAVTELRRCSGQQFDPAVVMAFERVLKQGRVEVVGADATPLERLAAAAA
jgi:putative two-component system response regulator